MRQPTLEPLWFALRVQPRHERTVAEALAFQHLEPFAPFYRELRKWSDRVKAVELPLFPGYAFCRFAFADRFTVLNTRGVLGILGAGKLFDPVSDEQIAALRKVVQSGLAPRPYPYFAPGDPVVVERGPLAGVRGTVLRHKGTAALVITVDVLERSIVVEVDPGAVEPEVPVPVAHESARAAAGFTSLP
jgi:transcription antitermination factor NusG